MTNKLSLLKVLVENDIEKYLIPPFYGILGKKHKDKTMIKIYVDGATKGNPGLGALGVLIVENNQQTSFKKALPFMSNHEAEFFAAIEGLRKIPHEKREEVVFLYTDSQVVFDSLKKRLTKNPTFQPLLRRLLFLADTFAQLEIIFQKDNLHQGAHQLAQQALHLHDRRV